MRLHIVPGQFMVEHLPHATFPEDDEWVALIRAPEGLTVIRDASPFAETDRWVGFYGDPGDLDTPGVLAGIVGPVAEAGVPVFVVSTYHSDLVLVPEHRSEVAAGALRDAGHRVENRPAPGTGRVNG